ncbi:MAG: hypothetical protein J7K58_05245 [Euryarchaeota archaeon]|nr:hypothetical protein [Euryarchaeota archaeon]
MKTSSTSLTKKGISLVLLILIFLEVLAPVISAQEHEKILIGKSEIYILGVSEDSSGRKYGTHSKLIVEVYRIMNGKTGGKVYINAMPVPDKMFYTSAIIASRVASIITGYAFYSLEFHYEVASSSVSIEGPSAGAAMAVAAVSAIWNMSLPKDILITGMLLPGGIIGPVGSLKEKVEAAKALNCRYLLVPYGQSETLIKTSEGYVKLRDYAEALGIQIIDVLTIEEALKEMLGITLPSTNTSLMTEYSDKTLRGYLIKSVNDDINHIDSIKTALQQIPSDKPLPERIMSYVNDFLKEFNTTFSEGTRLAENGDYYSALSKLFQASIYLRAVYYIRKYYTSEYPPATLGEIHSEVLKKLSEVEDIINTNTGNKIKLSLDEFYRLGAVEFRLLEAEYYLKLFNSTVTYPENIPEALYYLAFAYERARTAIWWYNIPESSECNITVDSYAIAEESLAYAQSMIEFLNNIGGSSQEINTLKEYLWSAYRSLEKRYYPGTFFTATAIISTVSLVMYKMYISAEYLTGVSDALQNLLESIVQKMRYNPHFIVLSRLEYGKVLKQTDVDSSIYMFLEGVILSTVSSTEGQTIIIEENTTENGVEINVERGIRSEIFFIIGLIAGIVIGITLLSKD